MPAAGSEGPADRLHTVTDTGDGVHPNDTGFQKMADRWYPPLEQVLNGVIPTPTASHALAQSPSPSPSATPSPGNARCTAIYRVISQ